MCVYRIWQQRYILLLGFNNSLISWHFCVTGCLIFQDGMRSILYNLQLLVGDYVYCECLTIDIRPRLTTIYGLALFPSLPRFSSSVCIQSNTRKRRAAKNVTEKAWTLTWREWRQVHANWILPGLPIQQFLLADSILRRENDASVLSRKILAVRICELDIEASNVDQSEEVCHQGWH